MQSIRVFIVSVGLGLLLTCGWAAAQDAAKSAVQVIIGADGSVKVIDPKTGKELPSVVTKVAPKTIGVPARIGGQLELELARGELEKLLGQAKKIEGKKAGAQDEPRVIEFEFVPSSGDQPKIIIFQRRPPEKPATLDQKVDRLLQEMAELRRDVNQLKGKLDGKNWQGGPWMIGPFGPKDGKGNKPVAPPPPPPPPPAGKEIEFHFKIEFDKATKKQLEEMLKKLEGEAGKKPGKKVEAPKAPDRNAEVDRILERMIREVEELRQEIRKSKGAPK